MKDSVPREAVEEGGWKEVEEAEGEQGNVTGEVRADSEARNGEQVQVPEPAPVAKEVDTPEKE